MDKIPFEIEIGKEYRFSSCEMANDMVSFINAEGLKAERYFRRDFWNAKSVWIVAARREFDND